MALTITNTDFNFDLEATGWTVPVLTRADWVQIDLTEDDVKAVKAGTKPGRMTMRARYESTVFADPDLRSQIVIEVAEVDPSAAQPFGYKNVRVTMDSYFLLHDSVASTDTWIPCSFTTALNFQMKNAPATTSLLAGLFGVTTLLANGTINTGEASRDGLALASRRPENLMD